MANGGGLDRVAGKIQQAGISFLTGIPQIELDRRAADTALVEAQAGDIQSATEQEKVKAQADLDFQRLSRTAFAGGPAADAALQEIFVRNPEQAEELFSGLGAVDQSQREDISRRAAEIQGTPPEQRRPLILQQAAEIEARGGDARQTLSLLEMAPEDQDQRLRIVQAAALSTQQRAQEQRVGGPTAETQTSAARAAVGEFTPEQIRQQARIEAGLDPRAGISARERIAEDPEVTEQVAESEAIIAERRKFGELTAAGRSKVIDKGFDSIQKIDANIRNLDEAIAAIDAGASTGAIESRFLPTFRESTIALEQIQAQLGLDVVSAVQFGALSEGELQLALATALPTGLQPPELRQWIERRKAAQTKLRDYFSDQIDFLDQGGSIAGFLRQQRRGGNNVTRFDAQGNQI